MHDDLPFVVSINRRAICRERVDCIFYQPDYPNVNQPGGEIEGTDNPPVQLCVPKARSSTNARQGRTIARQQTTHQRDIRVRRSRIGL